MPKRFTYKEPSKKIPVNVTFCVLFVWRVQTIGIGTARTIISVSKLVTPLAIAKVITL